MRHLIRTKAVQVLGAQIGGGRPRGGRCGGRRRGAVGADGRRRSGHVGGRLGRLGRMLIGQEAGGQLWPLLLPEAEIKGAEGSGRWWPLVEMRQQHLCVWRAAKHLQVLTSLLKKGERCSIRFLCGKLLHERIRKETQWRPQMLLEQIRVHGISARKICFIKLKVTGVWVTLGGEAQVVEGAIGDTSNFLIASW